MNDDEHASKQYKIHIMMTFTALFWAGAFIAGKIGVTEMSPVQLTFYRFLFASILIFIIMIKREKNIRIEKKDIHKIILMGLTGMVGYHIFVFNALSLTTAVNVSIVTSANPIITMFLSSIFLAEKLTVKKMATFLLALIGVLLTLTGWNLEMLMNMEFKTGELLTLMASICAASYAIMVKKLVSKYSPLVLTTYCFIVCLVIMFPFALREGLIPDVSVKAWLLCLYMAVFSSVYAYLVQQMSIEIIGPSKTTLYVNVSPFFAIILAWIILREQINLLNIISGLMIVYAVYLNAKVPKPKQTAVQILK